MSKTKLLYSVSALILLTITSCTLVDIEEDTAIYPTRIEALDINTLQQLNSDYQAANNNHLCSTLNEFGYTGFSRVLFPNDENPCLSREIVRIEMDNPDTLESYARTVLKMNELHTGIADSITIDLVNMEPLFGCTICEGIDVNSVVIEWKLTFSNQQKEGIDIAQTEIAVFIDAAGVNRIWGNWYPDFYNPIIPNFSVIEARNSIIGQEINLQTDDINISFSIDASHIQGSDFVQFRPIQIDNNLEFRKGYVLTIINPDIQNETWEAFVDVMDGNLLSLAKL